jgi:hypothetical protein
MQVREGLEEVPGARSLPHYPLRVLSGYWLPFVPLVAKYFYYWLLLPLCNTMLLFFGLFVEGIMEGPLVLNCPTTL